MTRRDTRQLSLLLPIEGAGPPAPTPLTDAVIDQLFAEWYRGVSRKRHPHDARKAFAAVLRGGKATIEQLTEGMTRYVQECRRKGTEPRYVLHPATWLRGGCWLDEPDEPSPLSKTASAFSRVVAAGRSAGNHR